MKVSLAYTFTDVSDVSIGDLRNHAGEIVERAQRGERVTITRAGQPVAQIVALPRQPVVLDALRQRWARLPRVDPAELRRDPDAAR